MIQLSAQILAVLHDSRRTAVDYLQYAQFTPCFTLLITLAPQCRRMTSLNS